MLHPSTFCQAQHFRKTMYTLLRKTLNVDIVYSQCHCIKNDIFRLYFFINSNKYDYLLSFVTLVL
jgi:hypothetical protein